MGQSTVIATAFTAIIFVAGVSILLMTSVASFGTLVEAITDQAHKNDLMIHERIEFKDWHLEDSNTLMFNVSNTGDTSITLRKFETMDLIVTYTASGEESTKWLIFNQDATVGDFWKINRVFFSGSQYDLINPMELTSPIHGAWDPDETIEISINLADAAPTFQYISLITPNGVQAHSSLTVEYDYGKVTIPDTSLSVTVYHDLGRVPVNIQITPGGQYEDFYWTRDLTDNSFVIELKNNPSIDTDFYWYIR